MSSIADTPVLGDLPEALPGALPSRLVAYPAEEKFERSVCAERSSAH